MAWKGAGPHGSDDRSFAASWSRSAGLFLSLAAFGAGCGQGEDREITAKLATVAVHRSTHPHYPVVVVEDFGSESQPAGIALDAYGLYVHETTKVNPRANVLSQTAAADLLERAFERSIQSIQSAEKDTPPPKAPYPANLDWKHSPHPKFGSYVIVSRCGAVGHTFDVELASTAISGQAPTPSTLRPVLSRDASLVVSDGAKAQESALRALKTPGGFSLCTKELLDVQQGNRGVEPHLTGGPLLLTPIDRSQAIKALGRTVNKLLGDS